MSVINPLDIKALREQFERSNPRFIMIDGFLDPDFAERARQSFPCFSDALAAGKTFSTVNEKGKVQITDQSLFPASLRELNDALSAAEFRRQLNEITGINNLLPDDQHVGGGIHETRRSGHLDVHVDFNFIKDRQLHRRLNFLIYFNRDWKPEWGGDIELWNEDVTRRVACFSPVFNRAVIFQTNETSFHGVTAVTCPPDRARISFAGYFYTREAPDGWDGTAHGTIFKARPHEKLKGNVLMPAEKAGRWLQRLKNGLKRKLRGQ